MPDRPYLILLCVAAYFLLLLLISRITSRNASNFTFFLGDKKSPWFVVAFGMIGASLSGVTFISVPGLVGANAFSYMQVVFGYVVGYAVVALVLMPLYYRLNLTSIYTYLDRRFGSTSYYTGSIFFLISRTIGAAFRLFLVASVLQFLVFDQLGVPFALNVGITILLIWVYTFQGGIKTIVWTDTLQTLFMLLAVILSVFLLAGSMDWSFGEMIGQVADSDYSKTFFFGDWRDNDFFWKQFIGGAFITIAMTGLDQDMMQKNLSCRNIGDAQKNMFTFSAILVVVNLIFLALGAMLYLYAESEGMAIPEKRDRLFPAVAVGELPLYAGLIFMVGLIAAAYSSADSALTSLTTSFYVDILRREGEDNRKTRLYVHIMFSVILLGVILLFDQINRDSVINELFTVATYTYGPLLGLYAFGLFTRSAVKDNWVPLVCIMSVLLSYLLSQHSKEWLWGYQVGFELLPINGLITFAGLWIIRRTGIKTEKL